MVLMERGSDTVVKRMTLSAMFLHNITTFLINTKKKFYINYFFSTLKGSRIKSISIILKTTKIINWVDH